MGAGGGLLGGLAVRATALHYEIAWCTGIAGGSWGGSGANRWGGSKMMAPNEEFNGDPKMITGATSRPTKALRLDPTLTRKTTPKVTF